MAAREQDGTSLPARIEESFESVRQALAEIQFGSILLTVHEGRIVQIDVTEKRRLTPR